MRRPTVTTLVVPLVGALTALASCAVQEAAPLAPGLLGRAPGDQVACDAVGSAWAPVIRTATPAARRPHLNRLDTRWGLAARVAESPALAESIAGAARVAHSGQWLWFGTWTEGMEGVRRAYERVQAACTDAGVDTSAMPHARTPRADG